LSLAAIQWLKDEQLHSELYFITKSAAIFWGRISIVKMVIFWSNRLFVIFARMHNKVKQLEGTHP